MNIEGNGENAVDTFCGYSTSCTPRWLQRFSNVKVFVFVLTLGIIVQGFAVNGINNVNTVMYERRYQLTSASTSLITVFEDLAGALVVIVIGYYGSTRHKPRIVAVSFLVMAAGLFIMCLAQFCSPPYNPVREGGHVNNHTHSSLGDESSLIQESSQGGTLKNYLYLLITGQIFNGYTAVCILTLGVSLVESSSSSSSSALYIGILSSGAVIGPAIGFLAGSRLLTIYVDFPNKPPLGLTPKDPAWVGAWWVGFTIATILSVVLAVILFMFPKEFPDTAAVRAAKVSEVHSNKTEMKANKPGFGMLWKDLPKATWYLITNPVYMLITFIEIGEFALMVAFTTFFTKIMIVQFRTTPSWAAFMSGCIAIPSAICGQLGGGIIVKKLKLTVPQILKFATLATAVAICITPFYLARCPSVKFAGVNAEYLSLEDMTAPDLNSDCNKDGDCTTSLYEPVCSNGVQYFSSCHAGCSEPTIFNGTKIYSNCSCTPDSNATVTDGMCQIDCPQFYSVYVPCVLLYFTFTSIVSTPLWVTTFRVTPPKVRTYGIAVQTTFVKLLGSVPGPLLLGAVIDATCDVWQDTDGTKGSCWVHDHKKLALGMLGFTLSIKALSLTFILLAVVLYKPPPPPEVRSIEEKESFLSGSSPDDSCNLSDK